MKHDLSLNSGERQTAVDFSSIRADHRFRYEWAAKCIPLNGFGLDVFCGNGYGTWLLSDSRFIIGIDGSSEAIDLANKYYRRSSNFFSASYYPFELPEKTFDFIVALESIEHVPKGDEFFSLISRALKPGGDLIFSTPCENFLPHSASGNHFHHKHYTLKETLEMANSRGLKMIDFAGQNVYGITTDGRQGDLLSVEDMQLKSGVPGQFIIVHSRAGGDRSRMESLRAWFNNGFLRHKGAL